MLRLRDAVGADNIFDTNPDMNIPGNQGSAQFLLLKKIPAVWI